LRLEDGVLTIDGDATCAEVEAAVAPWLFASDRPDETVRAWIDRGGCDLLAGWLGPTRAQVLGIEVEGGLRFGGRVVKNVAGYDLARVFVGARGELGRVVRAHVRARPAPRGWHAARREGTEPDEALGGPGCAVWVAGATWRFLRHGETAPRAYEPWAPLDARAALRADWAGVRSLIPYEGAATDGVLLGGVRLVGVTAPPTPRADPLWSRLVEAFAG